MSTNARLVLLLAMALLCTPCAFGQQHASDIIIELRPMVDSGPGIGWSPKAASVPLARSGEELVGSFLLGPDGSPKIRVALRRTPGATHCDGLALDSNRDGKFQPEELLTTTPKERRGKIWSSFVGSVQVPVVAPDGKQRTLAYPLALWFVANPAKPAAAPRLRWSRRGWMEGSTVVGGERIWVVLAEQVMDGVFDQRDRWSVGSTSAAARDRNTFRGLDDHNWRGESAFRVVTVHASGLQVKLQPFDPGMTRAVEKAARDRYAADRRARRAQQPLAFGHDFAAAEASAKVAGKRLFLDFETTWCGPCKQMDRMVYTAQSIVDAAAQLVAVKVDGDKHPDLVERFSVAAYPTMILLGPDGKEIRRAVGYQSVAKMRAFLGK